MVTGFFLISGFVLSYRSVLLIRSGEHERLSGSLVSLIFRRGFRLFLPPIAGIIFEKILVPCIYRSPPPVWTMISDVYAQTSAVMYCWRWDEHNVSLLHLWTIPIEFSCSMLLFLVIMGVSRLRTWMRLFVVGVLIIHSNASGHWAVLLFMAGLFIAETEVIIEQRKRSQKGNKSIGERMQWISRLQLAFWIAIFLVGLYLAGYPIHRVEISFDFRWVYPHTPKVYVDTEGFYLPLKFWTSVSSVLVIVALFRVPTLQKAFTTPVAQYLGDVSYSVYLVHNAVQISIGADIKAKVHSWFGADNSQWKRAAILVLDIAFIMGIVIWVVDIFWRFVEKPISSSLEQDCDQVAGNGDCDEIVQKAGGDCRRPQYFRCTGTGPGIPSTEQDPKEDTAPKPEEDECTEEEDKKPKLEEVEKTKAEKDECTSEEDKKLKLEEVEKTKAEKDECTSEKGTAIEPKEDAVVGCLPDTASETTTDLVYLNSPFAGMWYRALKILMRFKFDEL
ncbi:hypothetical protein H633G_04234 [Metarhizium anisopliae BRIP 53284]|nr:hypothetical protein H633G_04234 [Metarhizium anisopliae BRIP 53284]